MHPHPRNHDRKINVNEKEREREKKVFIGSLSLHTNKPFCSVKFSLFNLLNPCRFCRFLSFFTFVLLLLLLLSFILTRKKIRVRKPEGIDNILLVKFCFICGNHLRLTFSNYCNNHIINILMVHDALN